MFSFHKNVDLRRWVVNMRSSGHSIGFAPTMGALHQGHLDLVRRSTRFGDKTVVSIFVNPTQFNDPADLEKYPRTPGRDLRKLLTAGCDAVYLPEVEDVYPPGEDISVSLDFGTLDKTMEGAFRPGHFAGMATVVHRLLQLVQPDRLYMGQKDYQQLSIVREMISQLKIPVELIMVPTHREPDGLALSSRNVRLTTEMRAAAPSIYRTLMESKERLSSNPVEEVRAWALENLRSNGLDPEYFEIVDGHNLLPVSQMNDNELVIACTAVNAGDVRLIDNAVMKGEA